jgi:hypothetical protein
MCLTSEEPVIRSDAKGYHAYLRALFINHDLGQEPPDGEYLHGTPTGTLNKYFAGVAVLMLPFFGAAHAYALLSGGTADGLSEPYGLAIALAGLCYTFLGLWCLRALLLRQGVSQGTTAWVLAILGFATQLLQYTSIQPGWSHAYSFGLFGLFLLLVHQWGQALRPGLLVALGVVLGLVILTRPVNALVVLAAPMVWGGTGTRKAWSALAQHRGALALALVAGTAVLAIQPWLWFAQTGEWWQWGYRGEGFYWGNPRIGKVLFSVRRGLFVWTPVLLLALLAAMLYWRKDRFRAAWWWFYFAANTYVISAWWIWYYGSGFGMRPYVEHYTVLLLPLAWLADGWKAYTRKVALFFTATCAVFHYVQFQQYAQRMIPRERVTPEIYARTFLRFDERLRDCFGGNYQEPFYHPNGMDTIAQEDCDLEGQCSLWQVSSRTASAELARSGTHLFLFSPNVEFGPALVWPAGSLPVGRILHLTLDLQRYEEKAGDSFGALMVLSVEDPATGAKSYYDARRLDEIPGSKDRHWAHAHYEIPVPHGVKAGEELRCYIWNQGKCSFAVDDLHARLMAVRPY